MHQNLSCCSYFFSLEVGVVLFEFFLVILFDNSYPLLKPSSKDCFKVNEPFADPIEVSF